MSILITITSLIELVITILAAIYGGIFYSQNGGYPKDLLEMLKGESDQLMVNNSFDFMFDTFFDITLIFFLTKILFFQIGLFIDDNKESGFQAVICEIISAVACILGYLASEGKIGISEIVFLIIFFISLIALIIILKNAGAVSIVKYHLIQMGIEFLVMPFILYLIPYGIKAVIIGLIVAMIVLSYFKQMLMEMPFDQTPYNLPRYNSLSSDKLAQENKTEKKEILEEQILKLDRSTQKYQHNLKEHYKGTWGYGNIKPSAIDNAVERNIKKKNELIKKLKDLE